MSAVSTRQRLSTWIAILAILAMSLAPALSAAMAAAQASGLADLCLSPSSSSARLNDAAPKDTAPTLAHLFDHCPYCANHLPALGMPPHAGALHFIPTLSDEPPAAFLQAPRSLFAWSPSQARAPPTAA